MIPWWLKVAAVLFAVVVLAAMAFAIFEPLQVLPRIRLAPGYALTANDGSSVTSETSRGSVTLYAFAPTDCESECDRLDSAMSEVGERVAAEVDLGDVDFVRFTIALDDEPPPEALERAAQRSGADGQGWRWLGGPAVQIRTVVGSGFEVFFEQSEAGETIRFDPTFVLVDGSGVIRGEYQYQTVAGDSEKLVHHIDILAEEIRYAEGPAAVAYEAAHLFLCYP